MDIFERVKILASKDRNEYLDAAMSKGNKVMGYFCSYIPEEIIHAAGFIPYRMRAVDNKGTVKGGVYYSALNCSYVKSCFGKALEGDFSFLDGIVFMNGCDHLRRMYDNWKYADVSPPFRHMFVTPHLTGDTAFLRYQDELYKFIESIENFFHIKISEESLRESVLLYNEKRRLLSKLYESRKSENLPIRGSELLNLMLAVTMMPVIDAIKLIQDVLTAIEGRSVSSPGEVRVFISSGCLEEGSHLELIEECGGAIVADNMCLGSRHIDLSVDEKICPIKGIARRYLEHLSCPRMMDDFWSRLDYLQRTRREYSVDGVIGEKLKFCDLWGGELYLMKQESKKTNFPMLLLERELYGSGDGQVRTRIQAFFEQVKNTEFNGLSVTGLTGDTLQYQEPERRLIK